MRISAATQEMVQSTLAELPANERRELVGNCHVILAEAGDIFTEFGRLDRDIERASELSIETIVRAECIENGRGAFYRLFRRISLVRKYFGAKRTR